MDINEEIKALRNDFISKLNRLQHHIQRQIDNTIQDNQEMLLSIYIENGELKIRNFVESDPFHGEPLLLDALIICIASLIYKKFELSKDRKEYLEMVKRRIEKFLETDLENHPCLRQE